MKNMQKIMREVLTAHRDNMANVDVLGLDRALCYAKLDLHKACKWHVSELRKTRKMEKATADWSNARDAYKAAYLIHDRNRADSREMVKEFERDVKTLESRMNPTAAEYSAHPWNVDVEVYIYDETDMDATDITDTEIDAYVAAVTKCLRGEFGVQYGAGGRGFSFCADDADMDKLDDLLDGLAKRGCIIEYPDWYYINEIEQ